MKILLSAYACEPGRGSEPHAGWCWSEYLAKTCDITVITRSNNRVLIEQALAKMSGPKPKFIYYDLPDWIMRLKREGLPLSIYYIIWQIGASRRVARLLLGFDIVHHVTFNSFLVPGFWWCGDPAVILGPLGGGMTTPRELLSLFGKERWREILRTWCIRIGSFNPLLWVSLKFARAVLAANSDTRTQLCKIYAGETQSMVDVGIRENRVQTTVHEANSGYLRILWVGTLEPRKAPFIALQAFAKHVDQLGYTSLDFIGDGPQREMLQRFTETRCLGKRVRFRGRLNHDEAVAAFREADVFLFTSVRDTSGNVLLEAMAAGLPSIVLSHQGAAEMTTPETAICVAPADPETVARQFAEGILTLARDPELRARMGEAARQRVLQHFTWEKKSEAMLGIYRKVLGKTAA